MFKQYIQISLFLVVCTSWNALRAENTPLTINDQQLQEQEVHEATQTEQQELDEDDQTFYKNLLWIGVGSLAIAGIAVFTYLVLKRDSENPIQFGRAGDYTAADLARLRRIEDGTFTDADLNDGENYINRCINNPNENPGLRRLLQASMSGVAPTVDELRDIDDYDFIRARNLIEQNLHPTDNRFRFLTLSDFADQKRRI